jgi:hypothetical protein
MLPIVGLATAYFVSKQLSEGSHEQHQEGTFLDRKHHPFGVSQPSHLLQAREDHSQVAHGIRRTERNPWQNYDQRPTALHEPSKMDREDELAMKRFKAESQREGLPTDYMNGDPHYKNKWMRSLPRVHNPGMTEIEVPSRSFSDRYGDGPLPVTDSYLGLNHAPKRLHAVSPATLTHKTTHL